MKNRKIILCVLLSLFIALMMSALTVAGAIADNENFFKNGSFEDFDNIEMIIPDGFSATLSQDLEASAGVYSLKVTTANNYTHIGYPLSLEEGRTYEYSFDIKLISDGNGGAVTSATALYVNFVFADSRSSNQQKNHVLDGTLATSQSGWHHVKGTYTPSYSDIAEDADIENALFCIYANPTSNGGAIWLLDNVVIKRKPLVSEEDIVKTPDFISDNMLIQMGKQTPIYGTAKNAETLDVVLYNGNDVICRTTSVLENGEFDALLPAVNSYYKNLTLAFESDGNILRTIENVAVGELWHFSGQSNMEMPFRDEMPDIIPKSDMPDIHYFRVNATGEGEWVTVSTANIRTISAVAYKTLEIMQSNLGENVPVGGLNTAVGGMPMSRYMENEEKYLSHLVPISRIPVKGHFWYQGESDMNNTNYVSDLEAMIASWRALWNDKTQPFIFVQLPRSCATIPDWYGNLDSNGNPTMAWCYNYTKVHMWQYEAYQKLKNDNVYMIVSIDATTEIEEQKSVANRNAEDPLHPWNKAPIATRLANTALHETYGKTDIKHKFPMPSDVTVDGKHIYIEYSNVYDGLVTTGNVPEHFEIIDADGNYHTPTYTEIYSNNTVMLYCDNVEEPAGVCYFHEEHLIDLSLPFQTFVPSLENSEGLPASPFTYTITEEDKISSSGTISVPAGSVVYFADGSTKICNTDSNVRVPAKEGYVYVNTGYTGHEVYSVSADGVPTKLDVLDNALLGYNGASIRTSGNIQGMRMRASTTYSSRMLSTQKDGLEITEQGFIVTAETNATGLKNEEYTLDMALVSSGKAFKGISFSKSKNINLVYDIVDDDIIFTTVASGIPMTKSALVARIAFRPYYILSDGENETTVYGEITKRSVYEVALAIKKANNDDYTNNQEYIDLIIETVGFVSDDEISFDASELYKN